MTTITKERLLTIKQWRETYGPGSNVVLPAEEAEELAQKIRKAPLCDNCQYCRCKDQEVFEMEAAELQGDPERALELARKGHEEWPAEEDLMVAISRLERKAKG